MRSKTRRTFSSEFRLESAQLVVDQRYRIREDAQAVAEAHRSVVDYIIAGYCSHTRPHKHNGGMPPNKTEERY
ncbi:MAG: hypothetical protein ACI9DH_001036 [Halioglobus sp.]|jgi:hypothetical protein